MMRAPMSAIPARRRAMRRSARPTRRRRRRSRAAPGAAPRRAPQGGGFLQARCRPRPASPAACCSAMRWAACSAATAAAAACSAAAAAAIGAAARPSTRPSTTTTRPIPPGSTRKTCCRTDQDQDGAQDASDNGGGDDYAGGGGDDFDADPTHARVTPADAARAAALAAALKAKAAELGFDLCRIAPPEAPAPAHDGSRNGWRSAATATWRGWTTRAARGPRALWPEVRACVMVGVNYAPAGDPLAATRRPASAPSRSTPAIATITTS